MNWKALSNGFNRHLSNWLEELFGGEESVLIDTSEFDSDAFEADELISVLEILEDIAPVTVLYHKCGPSFVELRRGQLGEENNLLALKQVKLAIKYGQLRRITYHRTGNAVDSSYSFCAEISCPLDKDRYTSGRTNQCWESLEACRQAIHDILMLNPQSRVEVLDSTIGPTFDERHSAL